MSKGSTRSIWVADDVWEDVRIQAKLRGRSVSNFLVSVYVDSRRGKISPLPAAPVPVIREDRDLTEDERDVEVVQEAADNALKESKSVSKRKAIQKPNEGMIVNIEEPAVDSGGTVDWRDLKMSRSKSVTIDPGGTGKKSKMR